MLSQHYFLMFAIRLSRSTHFRYKITTFFANMQISAHFCTKNLKIDKSIWHFPPSPHPRALSPSSCTSRASLREHKYSLLHHALLAHHCASPVIPPLREPYLPHLIMHFSRIIARAPVSPPLRKPSPHQSSKAARRLPLINHCFSRDSAVTIATITDVSVEF